MSATESKPHENESQEELNINIETIDRANTNEPNLKDADDETAEGHDGGAEEGTGGAFNPETGEINWDCPCLGGMAHGPCGEEFKRAFSCFVYSEEEQKGVDCIEFFKEMQDCFREHPEIYKDDIVDDDEEIVEQETEFIDEIDDSMLTKG